MRTHHGSVSRTANDELPASARLFHRSTIDRQDATWGATNGKEKRGSQDQEEQAQVYRHLRTWSPRGLDTRATAKEAIA
jgi:hypothetical protein